MRTEIRRFRELIAEQKLDEARQMLSTVYQIIDQTSQNGAIHSNTAARYKSRLTRYLNVQKSSD
jgi:small subunit ribosomal protein S20